MEELIGNTEYDDYTQEELEQAVYQAGLHTFVQALPNGLETNVMENGSRFLAGKSRGMIKSTIDCSIKTS